MAVPAAPVPAPPLAAAAPDRIGVVTHYYGHVDAAIIQIESGEVRVGDTIHIRGHTTDFYQRIEHIELDHQTVEAARAGQTVGIQVSQRVREGDAVIRVSR
jgi:putative protease